MEASTLIGKTVDTSAPTRIDLAGGLLDLWPEYPSPPGAVAVGVAISRRAQCRVEALPGRVQISYRDTGLSHEGRDVSALAAKAPLVAGILSALGVETGVKVTLLSRASPASGLGADEALMLALAGAVTVAAGRDLAPESLVALVRDTKTQLSGAPAGLEGAHTAHRGGVVALHLGAGAVEASTLPTDPARLEESLLLVDTGEGGGFDGWALARASLQGSAAARSTLDHLAKVASEVEGALEAWRFEDIPRLWNEEWDVRRGVSAPPPGMERVAGIAKANGAAARVCGGGAGAVVALWAPPGERGPGIRDAVLEALKQAKISLVPFRIDLLGLEVREA